MKIRIMSEVEEKVVNIDKLNIVGVGGIIDLALSFHKGFNVICGANGIGKSTILNVIADVFAETSILKKNAKCEKGFYDISYDTETGVKTKHKDILKFKPKENELRVSSNMSKFLVPFDVQRSFDYIELKGISPDPGRRQLDNSRIAGTGVNANEIKDWFVKRYAFHDKKDSLSKNEIKNYILAQKMFSVLDKSVRFKTVLVSSLDVMLSTPTGEIYFEYLSSGYKSCIFIIMGIMKEIEYRFNDAPIVIGDFNGCILIDEIEEHLHPTWQAQLVRTLKELFPKAQFITTTHSPSVLQCLGQNEIIALGQDLEGKTYKKELSLGKYGLQGWTLEEILQDVMDMPSTTSELFQETIHAFDKAMDNEDILEIKKNYQILNKMLHPNSTLRKLLQIQMAGLEE